VDFEAHGSFLAFSSVSGLAPVAITVAPSVWNRFAIAAPIPVVPPEMSAILPSNLFIRDLLYA
jgi:hypothetical protein